MEIERALLSKLEDAAAVRQCWDQGIRSDVFEDPARALIYDFVVDYWVRNGMELAPTRDVFEIEFPDFDPEPTEESLTWLIGKIKSRYQVNQVQDIMREAAKIGNEDPQSALEMLYEGSHRAKNATAPRHSRVDMSDPSNIEARRTRYSTRQETQVRGAPIGLPEVDEHTGGLLAGELGIVAGYAKTGKTWALVNALYESRVLGWTGCGFTLEMTTNEFEDRIDAKASGVGYGKLTRGELTMEESRQLREGQERLAPYGPLHLERPEVGERTVANLINRARQIGSDYVVIDQLSWLEARGKYRDRRDTYYEIISDLKEECSRPSHPIPVFMAVQYNRQAVATPGQRGALHNIANAADVEQMVDIAYGLYRDRETRANNSMVLDILGARRSDAKSWLLDWHLNMRTQISVRGELEEDED